ncbi:hypothetical protein ATE47_15225 [Chryseobacterium sp. IHB B 17019]|jgi:hypothetical protein|uniref:RPB7/RPC8 family DNA-directed RNA polymerase subunit n=1 Tax=Chryseobacterium sp. IHB B 17019 TaxID=1721091 RepID=UPI0007224A88|nr:RPB7/RPC8 family DNA-directed RNA polymerase subunit [Chryseobacterium sp. IHB B 17019]ALR31783.1 hypothetical protein ATE47_15225 [Chryseobacterium sp. IHB B 17019]
MRKLILLAAFGVAGLVNAKSIVKSELQEEKETKVFQACGVVVTYYNANGQYEGTGYFSSEQPSLESCMAWQNAKIRSLRLQGYSVSLNANVN